MGFAAFAVQLVIGIIEALLALRLVLRLFGANPNAPFVAWVYDASGPFLYPFAGIFPDLVIRPGFVIELSVVIAMIAYSLIGYLIAWALARSVPPSP